MKGLAWLALLSACGSLGDDAADGASRAEIVAWTGTHVAVGRRTDLIGTVRNDAGDYFLVDDASFDANTAQVTIQTQVPVQSGYETIAEFLVAGDVAINVHAEGRSAQGVFHVAEARAPALVKHSLSIGLFEVCFITTNGNTYCYKDDLTTPASYGTGFVSLSSSGYTTCGLRDDRSTQCGLSSTGVTVPELVNMVSIGGGRDGSLGWVCGASATGDLTCSGTPERGLGLPATDVKAVAVSSGGRCVITSSREAVCGLVAVNAGDDVGTSGTEGAPGFRSPLVTNLATPVAGELFWEQITDGDRFSCGLTEDHDTYCWGLGGGHELGVTRGLANCPGSTGTPPCSKHPLLVEGGHHFTQIAASSEGARTCGLDEQGNAWCWGSGSAIGDGTSVDTETPTLVTGGHQFVEIAVSARFQCGVTSAGELWCWGVLPRQIPANQAMTPTLVATPAPIVVQ